MKTVEVMLWERTDDTLKRVRRELMHHGVVELTAYGEVVGHMVRPDVAARLCTRAGGPVGDEITLGPPEPCRLATFDNEDPRSP